MKRLVLAAALICVAWLPIGAWAQNHAYVFDSTYVNNAGAERYISIAPAFELGDFNEQGFTIGMFDSSGADTQSCRVQFWGYLDNSSSISRHLYLDTTTPISIPARIDSFQFHFPAGHESIRLRIMGTNGSTSLAWWNAHPRAKNDTTYVIPVDSVQIFTDDLLDVAVAGAVSEVTECANVTSVDLVDEVTECANVTSVELVDEVTECANVTSVDLVDAVTTVDEVTECANVTSVDLVDAVTTVTTVDAVTAITNTVSTTEVSAGELVPFYTTVAALGVPDSIAGTTAKYHVPITKLMITALDDTLWMYWTSEAGVTPTDSLQINPIAASCGWPIIFEPTDWYQIYFSKQNGDATVSGVKYGRGEETTAP